MIHFVGAGPGAEDLITVRGARLLEEADTIIYAGSLVNPALLRRAGVEVAINTDAPEVPIDLLAASVAIAVKAGVPREKAIPLISGSAASICGIGDRVGRIAPGLDGDILIFGEGPIGLLVKPEHIFVDGKQLR